VPSAEAGTVAIGSHRRQDAPVRGVLAVDIGGTKLVAGIVVETGQVVTQERVPTGVDPWEALAPLVRGVLRRAHAIGIRPDVCGVGCGGPMTPGGEEVSPLNIPGWRGFPLRSRLAALSGLPTAVDNDAKALALGEGWCGAARGEGNFLAMVVSTGVGGGLVIDGRLLDGAAGNAGHIGHVIVEPDGRACACGARGCLEAEASGPSILAATGRPPEEATPAVVERTGRLVGRAVASVAALCDLRLAVVAGSVALGFGAPFFAAAQRELDERCRIAFARGARIVPAGLGADGPLVGAGAVGLRHLGVELLGGGILGGGQERPVDPSGRR
jgi:glucokinase